MTIMTKRNTLLLLVLLAVAGVAAVAIIAYGSILHTGAQSDSAAAAEAKLLAERVLFSGIVATLIVLSGGIAVIIRSVKLTQLLDKLVAMNRMSGFSPESALARLGDVGDRIATIYHQVSELSEKKSRKISGLTALNELLLNVSDQMVMIVDAAGHVLQASRPLLERLDRARGEIVGVHLDDLLPGANIDAAIREASQTRSAVVRERHGDSIVFDPVINSDAEVSYLVAVITKSVSDDIKSVAISARTMTQPSVRRGFFRRLLKRR